MTLNMETINISRHILTESTGTFILRSAVDAISYFDAGGKECER